MKAENYKQELINVYKNQELSVEDFENTLDHYTKLVKEEIPTEWKAEDLEFITNNFHKWIRFAGDFKIRLKQLPNHTNEILRLAKEMNVTVTFEKK